MSTILRILSAGHLRHVSRSRAIRIVPALALLLTVVQSNALAIPQDPAEPVRGHTELDGNVVHNTATDWADLFTGGTDAASTPHAVASLPSGFSAAVFSRDFTPGSTKDTTTYATGSKDTLDINPGWQCSASNNLGDKVDMLNSYAVIFKNPAITNPDLLVYFGLERASNNGAGDVGFWLLQDKTVGCDAAAGTTTFTGHHFDGDLLIVSEFSVGGTISTIKVFAWQGTANPANPLALKADISSPEPNCLNAAPPASTIACAVVNTTANQPNGTGTADDGLISTPWLTQPASSTLPKVLPAGFTAGHTLAPTEFYEGALNVTALLGSTPCFAKFVPDTRSSPSTTATLFDFAVANFASCPTGLATTPSPSAATIPATLNDSATLTGATDPVSGTITFSLFGAGDTACAGAAIYTATANVTGNGSYSTTGAASTTGSNVVKTPGTYEWTASYSGDANGNQASSSGCGLEVVTVGKATPTEATAQNLLPNDSATVTGVTGIATPTGTIDFKLFGPSDPTCSGTPVFQSLGAALSNGSASTSNTTFTVDAASAGNYKWTVHYSGDANYDAADKACGAEQFTASITNQ